jgi:lipoprotein-anchoring transpeptidase ErfK/SrfK
MNDNADPLRNALENARISYHQGNRSNTRYWAQIAIKINPNIEEPWLWLAAVSSPRVSVTYLQKALSLNPQSQRARQGMHWAIKRARLEPAHKPQTNTTISTQPASYHTAARISTISTTKSGSRPHLWVGILVLLAVISCALVSPAMGFYINTLFLKPETLMAAQVGLLKASNTSTPSNTPTITPSPTPTETPTSTPTETPTPLPTDTSTPTFTPYPTDTDYPTQEPVEYDLPEPGGDGRWIDVDLSDQVIYAFEDNEIVRSFLVSTGTWLHPTITGQYYIYVKYEYSDMAGPGYYLPDVPYVMYFYDGYGLHGTYWHSNFGTPMSHGCINLTIPDSEWLYYWADIGTLVNIHE